jgi:hypothetical protein
MVRLQRAAAATSLLLLLLLAITLVALSSRGVHALRDYVDDTLFIFDVTTGGDDVNATTNAPAGDLQFAFKRMQGTADVLVDCISAPITMLAPPCRMAPQIVGTTHICVYCLLACYCAYFYSLFCMAWHAGSSSTYSTHTNTTNNNTNTKSWKSQCF